MFVSCAFYTRPVFSVYLCCVWFGGVTSREAEIQPAVGSGPREREGSARATETQGPSANAHMELGRRIHLFTDSQDESKSTKSITNPPSARRCFNPLHWMGSRSDPIQLDVSKGTFLPMQIMELKVEETRYLTSHLHIKHNLIGEAITELYKWLFFYCNTNQQSTESGPNSPPDTPGQTLQPRGLKPSTDSGPLIPPGTSPLQINYFL